MAEHDACQSILAMADSAGWQVQGQSGRIKKISKTMSYLLRHGAQNERLPIAKDGYLPISALIAHKNLRRLAASKADVLQIAADDKKARFHVRDDCIRANQGHSMLNVLVNMEEIKDAFEVPVAVHGTIWTAWDHIKHQGLSVMGRQHIHLATNVGTEGVISGMRTTSQVWIYVDIPKMLEDGIRIFRSRNGVILTRGIDGVLPTKYFKSVVNARKRTVIFPPPAE